MKFSSKFFESSKFSFIVFFLFPLTLFSQPGTWVAIYGGINYDHGRSIQQTFDKGYIVCAQTSSYGMGETDVYLLKIDGAGKYQWQNAFGGTGIENCFCVRQTADSGYVICGYTNSFGNGGYDAYLVKTDSLGHFQWQNTFGGTDWDFSYWTEQTKEGGYILCGETFSYGNNSQAYLVKTNSVGDTLWTRTFGGQHSDVFYEVHQTADHGYIAAGNTTTDAGDKDFYLVKTDSAGNKKWEKTFGGIGNDSCNSVTICKDGGFLLGGSFNISGADKMHYIKTDSLGNFKDSNQVTPPGNNSVSRIRETMDGQYATLVNASGGSFGVGEILYYKWNSGWPSSVSGSFGGADKEEGYDLQQTADSGFVFVGFTASFGIGPDNICIVKTNKIGNYNDSINAYLAVNEITEANASALIYPNPFSENIFLKIDRSFLGDEKKFSFEVSDLCGRQIMQIEKDAPAVSSEPIQIKIPSEKLAAGFYLMSLRSGNKKIYRKLLFVK
ncbi:MAG: T9SS type A sorting domain-containing protein [Bacteroidia bacterium]